MRYVASTLEVRVGIGDLDVQGGMLIVKGCGLWPLGSM